MEVPSRHSRVQTKERLGVYALGSLLLAATFVYSTFQFGRVLGIEFSPHDFKRREFLYRQIPLLGWQITPIRRTDLSGKLEDHLLKKELVTPPAGAERRWDLVVARRGSREVTRGDAHILDNYLTASRPDQELVWLDWSQKHPQAARILWPTVAQLADQQLYFFLPDLFALAEQNLTDLEVFRQKLEETLLHRYLQLAQIQQQLGQHQQALELFTEALRYKPGCVEALEGRAESHQALGTPEAASPDPQPLREAEELR